jgi:hypothetical protein
MTEQLTRHDLEAKVVKRCWENEGFRQEFTADPAGTFVKYLKVPASSLPKILVHAEEPGSWHIVLPTKSSTTSELSEEDLAKVAGGGTPFTLLLTVANTVATALSGTAVATAAIESGSW